jgi:hypothetical protein
MGELDGRSEGITAGAVEGTSEGAISGDFDGTPVGLSDCCSEGLAEGGTEGTPEDISVAPTPMKPSSASARLKLSKNTLVIAIVPRSTASSPGGCVLSTSNVTYVDA